MDVFLLFPSSNATNDWETNDWNIITKEKKVFQLILFSEQFSAQVNFECSMLFGYT